MTAVSLAFHRPAYARDAFTFETDTPDHSHRFVIRRTPSRMWQVETFPLTPCGTPGIYTPALTSIRTEHVLSRNAAFLMAEAIYRAILDRAAAEDAAELAALVADYQEAIREARQLEDGELVAQLEDELATLSR